MQNEGRKLPDPRSPVSLNLGSPGSDSEAGDLAASVQIADLSEKRPDKAVGDADDRAKILAFLYEKESLAAPNTATAAVWRRLREVAEDKAGDLDIPSLVAQTGLGRSALFEARARALKQLQALHADMGR